MAYKFADLENLFHRVEAKSNVVEEKSPVMDNKLIDVGNKLTDLDNKLVRVTTHSPSRDRQTASRIHPCNPLPFQSRARLNYFDCGFVKRAEAAQGFSRSAAKFPFTDRQRKGRHNLFSEVLTWKPAAHAANNGLAKARVMSLIFRFAFLI